MPFFASPRILWGTNLINPIIFDQLIDNATSYSEPRKGSVFSQAESGTEDSWIVGLDYYLEFDARFLPTVSPSFPYTSSVAPFLTTGWDDDTNGWRLFLENARAKNLFLWISDGTNLMVNTNLQVSTVTAGVPDFWTFNDQGLNATSSIDPVLGDLISVKGGAATLTPVQLLQENLAIYPGNTFTCSIDCMVSGTSAGSYAQLQVIFTSASVNSSVSSSKYSGTTFSRLACSGSALANYQNCFVLLTLNVLGAATTSASAYYKDVALYQFPQKNGTVFTSGSYPIYCTLVDPMDGAPTIEENGMRNVHFKIRSIFNSFDGY